MDVARNDDDGLAPLEDLVPFGRRRVATLEVEPAFELPELLAAFQRVGRADLETDERVALRRLAEFAHVDPIRGGVHQPEVLQHLVPPRELAIGAHGVAEERRRRRHGAGRGGAGLRGQWRFDGCGGKQECGNRQGGGKGQAMAHGGTIALPSPTRARRPSLCRCRMQGAALSSGTDIARRRAIVTTV